MEGIESIRNGWSPYLIWSVTHLVSESNRFQRYQLSRFLVLMNQYDQAMKATETATNSAGSGYRENAEYLKSYEAQINMVKNAWTEAIIAMRDSGLGDGMIVGLNVGLEFFKVLTSVIDNVGLLPAVLGTAAVAFLLFSSRADMAKTATNGFLISGLQRIPIVGKVVTAELSAMSIGMQRLAAGSGIAATSVGLLRTALSMAFPIAAIMAVGAALSWVTSKISEQIEKQKMLKKEFEEFKQKSVDAVSTNKEQVDSLIASYTKLEDMKLSGNWDNAKEEEYLRIQQELGDLFPSLVKELGVKGEKHLIAAEAIEKEVEAAQKLYEAEQMLRLAQSKDTYKEKIKDIKEYQKELNKAEGIIKHGLTLGMSTGMSADEIDIKKAKAQSDILVFQELGKFAASEYSKAFYEDLAIQMKMMGQDVTPVLMDVFKTAFDEVDFTPIDEKQAEQFRNAISSIGTEMNKAISSGNLEQFNELSESFQAVLVQMGLTEVEAKKLTPSFNQITATIERNAKAMAENAKITDEFGNEMSGLGEETDEAGKKIYKFKDALEMLTGVYKEQLTDVDDWLYTIKALSDQANLTAEQTALLGDTQQNLIAQYPHLSSESMKLIERYEELGSTSYRAATNSEELAETQKRLLELHPDLMNAGISREKLIGSIIAKIEAEANANDILLAATIASKKGTLTAEEETTLGHLRETNVRIENINAEIIAVDKLEQAYAAFSEDKRRKAIETAQGIGMGSAFQAAMKATDFAKQFSTEQGMAERRKTLLAELASATADRGKYTDILSQSEEVLSNATTSANKALADKIKNSKTATKAQKEAAKAMEHSIFVADKYKRALEELNLKIKEQQDIQSQFPDYTSKHQAALQAELKLQQDKMNLLKEQEKNLQAQIKAGKILNTGIVTTKTGGSPTSLSGWSGSITSQYGMRKHPIYGDMRMHDGIDIGGKLGTRLDANVSGKVVFAGNKGNGLGNYVTIQTEDGLKHIYAHLDKVVAKLGDTITVGMQVGTIGKSGAATGSHLHYQVNDASGKSVNPSSYLDSARKGVSTASKEAAQVLADIDSAQSELISLQGQLLDQENTLNQLILKNINAQLSTFDNKRDVYQRILDYEAEKIKTLDLTSERYIKTLERNTMYLEKKQATNKKELEYLNQLIKKGGLSGIALEEMKVRAEELAAEMLSLGVSIRELSANKIDAVMKKLDEGIEDISYSLERSKLIQEAYEEGSLDYNNEAKNQIEIIKEHQQAIVNKRNELQRLILTENIGTEKAKEYSRQIQQLSLEYWQLANSAKNAEKALEDSNKAMVDNLANSLIESYKSVISSRRDAHMRQLESEMDDENRRHELTMANIDREMDSERERHKELQDYYDYQIEMEEKSHKKKMDNLKKQLREFERYIQSQIEGIDRVENTRTYEKDIEKLQKEKNEIQRMLNELAGDDSYEAQAKRKELNKRLEEVDDQLFERRNAREIELRKENYDDLLEKEQLRVEQIEENEIKLHEQKLDDIKELKKREDELHNNNMKNLENRKKAEDATHKARVNNINDLKKYWTQFYDDQLNNEREFARIREEIVKGNLDALGEEFQKYMDEMIATMPELENTMNGTMQAVGTAVRQNLIDNLREALRLMNEFNAKSNTSRPVSSPSSGSGGSSGGSSSSSRLSSGDLNVLTGKFLNDKLAPSEDNANRKATIKDKGHSLADAGRASGSTISATQGFDSVVAGLSNDEKKQLGQYLTSNATGHVSSDYLKDQIRDYANRLISSSARFDTGGFTGKFSGGKLATLDPEELILDKKDTKTFAKTMDILDRVFNMINPLKIPSITPPSLAQGTGQGNIEINFNVDKMTGDKNDVDKFTRQVARTLKRERGIR